MTRASVIGATVVALYSLVFSQASAVPTGVGQRPTINLLSSSVTVGDQPSGFGGMALLRIRFCGYGGPKAVLRIRESAKQNGRERSRVFTEPLGVNVTRHQRYGCVRRFVVQWLIPKRFLTGREYSVAVRLRDGKGDSTRTVGFHFRR